MSNKRNFVVGALLVVFAMTLVVLIAFIKVERRSDSTVESQEGVGAEGKEERGKIWFKAIDLYEKPVVDLEIQILDMNHNVVDKVRTNEEGVAESIWLPLGGYYYKEISAPENIVIYSEECYFELSMDMFVYKEIVECRNTEYIGKGKSHFWVFDLNEEPVVNMAIEIQDENHNVIEVIYTDENGEVETSWFPLGGYYFKELVAPEGIMVDSTEYYFELINDNDINKEEIQCDME